MKFRFYHWFMVLVLCGVAAMAFAGPDARDAAPEREEEVSAARELSREMGKPGNLLKALDAYVIDGTK